MGRRVESSSFVSAASLIPSDYKVPDWKLNFLGHDEIWSAKVAIHGCGFRLDKSFASERGPIIYIAFYSPGAIARDVDHPLDVPLEREWFTVTPPLQKPPTGCCCLYI